VTCIVLDMAVAEAEAALADWKRRIESANAERDGLIRAAHEAGVNIRRISLLSGLSRSTVYKVLGLDEDRAPPT
jgi:transcriptional regulator of acetoin/glycerol metabolism